jgi:non-lysosomal glucosylceramidase
VMPDHIRATLKSIYRYNYKRSLENHDNVERTFALNEEAAMVICDYGTAPRPRIPFPYFGEVMTGFEHSTAALMLYSGMIGEGLECIENIRARYDGEKRNPWDEAECGHHYARAMASWTGFVALSGFAYDGSQAAIVAVPRVPHEKFECFWSTGAGWGTFSYGPTGAKGSQLTIRVLAGKLECKSIEMSGAGAVTSVSSNGQEHAHTSHPKDERTVFRLVEPITLAEGNELKLEIHA